MSSNIDAMKRILSKSRLLVLMENERIQNEINVMEVLVDELKQLIKRTNGFINQQKLTLVTREFHLKTSENVPFSSANRIFKSLPAFPERPRQRPKILDYRLIFFLFTEGYIGTNFANINYANSEESSNEENSSENEIEEFQVHESSESPDSPSSPDSPGSPESSDSPESPDSPGFPDSPYFQKIKNPGMFLRFY